MIKSYFKLPLDTQKIIKNKELDTHDLQRSIVGFIHLITTTCFGECSFDDSFGCAIWNIDFDNLTGTNRLRNTITEFIEESITLQEKRLKKIKVDVMIQQEELSTFKKVNRIKKRVDIRVDGVIAQTNEPFSCLEKFYIAPLSF